MKRALGLAAAALLASAPFALAQDTDTPRAVAVEQGWPAAVTAALADPARPEAERARDEARRAGDILTMIGVEQGDQVADLVIGGGYFTRLFASVVGAEGHVYAWQPAEFVGFNSEYGVNLTTVDAAYDNVSGQTDPFATLALPEGRLDIAFTAQNYHDFHLEPFPADTAAAVNGAVFRALKGCGTYVVIDHHAQAGTGFTHATDLHRAEPSAVQAEIEAAGFEFVSFSNLLANPEDPLTANVFDDSIRGRTSQFILVFRKPGEACPATPADPAA